MASFILYTYQFAPLSVNQSLFASLPIPEERMKNKQEYLQCVISNEAFNFKGSRDGKYEHRICYNNGGIIILKLANNKHTSLEENFKKRTYNYSPSCYIIIDNRKDVQHIAIEEDTVSFSTTDVAKNILEYSLRKALKTYGLTISINKEYQKHEFWQLIERYPKGVEMVRFQFSYPNLPRVSESIRDFITNQSKLTNSKETTFELKSGGAEQLSLSDANDQLKGLVEASAMSGNAITLKMKGFKRYIRTGETTQKIEIDDLEGKFKDEEIFQSCFEKIVESLNAVK